MKPDRQAAALTRLIEGLDFNSEQFFDLYTTPGAPAALPAEIDAEAWANVSSLTADLARLRGEMGRLRTGVETLRMPAVELVGLDRLAETLRSLEARLKPMTGPSPQQRPSDDEQRLQRVLKELLGVADTLELVLDLMNKQPGSVSDSVATGLRSVYQLLVDNFTRAGVKQAPATGVFDPHIHLAVGTEANPEVPDGHLSRTLQRGYYINDKVLRTAQVVVAKNAAAG